MEHAVMPRTLEPHCAWTRDDVANPDDWITHLTPSDIDEIDAALAHARAQSDDMLALTKADFPLETLTDTIAGIEHELINGRGFALLRGLPRERYTNDEMCLIYWGIGLHLGNPWPQNKHGHLLGDVTDQGRHPDDPEARGNELGGIALDFHCDGSDLVGLMCLENGIEGGESAICNSVAVYNEMVATRPDLAAELFQPLPYDFRGEQAPGGKSWYSVPAFTEFDDRIFTRYISAYIRASQRHKDAPRLSDKTLEAMDYFEALYADEKYHVYMAMQPGDMQFINNYHVLHGRKAYTDDRSAGKVRHLKRLWLETETLTNRPDHFRRPPSHHWDKNPTISRLDETPRPTAAE